MLVVIMRSRMKKVLLVSAVALVVAVVVVGGLSYLGYLYIGTKSPDQKLSLTYQACGKNIVDEYLTAQSGDSADSAKTKNLSNKIKALPHSDQDATCQAILFTNAFNLEQYTDMVQPLNNLQSLHDKGQYPDNNLGMS